MQRTLYARPAISYDDQSFARSDSPRHTDTRAEHSGKYSGNGVLTEPPLQSQTERSKLHPVDDLVNPALKMTHDKQQCLVVEYPEVKVLENIQGEHLEAIDLL